MWQVAAKTTLKSPLNLPVCFLHAASVHLESSVPSHTRHGVRTDQLISNLAISLNGP